MMARRQKLKVYRTPIGFHDAYVAAPSQKAALEAWGSDADLFARGVAETVTDEALTREPLDQPGLVIRRARGSAAEHIAALGPGERPGRAATPSGAEKAARPRHKAASRPPPKPRPRPSRAALDAAERALDDERRRQEEALAALRRREKRLQAERARLERQNEAETAKREATLDEARVAYEAAMAKWRE